VAQTHAEGVTVLAGSSASIVIGSNGGGVGLGEGGGGGGAGRLVDEDRDGDGRDGLGLGLGLRDGDGEGDSNLLVAPSALVRAGVGAPVGAAAPGRDETSVSGIAMAAPNPRSTTVMASHSLVGGASARRRPW
jgi:hypothetical protein